METNFASMMSEIFRIPIGYFTYPNIIFYFLIPFISATYFWYILLSDKLRIFRNSNTANVVLSVIISLINSYMIISRWPSLMTAFFLSAAFFIKGDWSMKKFIATGILFYVISYTYPMYEYEPYLALLPIAIIIFIHLKG